MSELQTIWYLLIAVLFIGYAVLDGFDLGVGNLHAFARSEKDKETMLASVGPFWDGNEVWLLTGGGAIFAAFPEVYATVFSGFYLALVLLLVALITRAVSVEFRNKVDDPAWKGAWDKAFFLGSLLPSILLGVAFGNIMRGVAVDASKEYVGGFFALLNPYAVLIGLVSLAMFTTQGAIYLAMKTDGGLREWAGAWARRSWAAFAALYAVATAASVVAAPHLFARYLNTAWPWALVALTVGALAWTRVSLGRESYGAAFVSSSVGIAGLIGITAVGAFPNIVRSTIDLSYSLTAMNASSSQRTLTVMFVLALIGMPIVIAYTAYIYRAFRGKAEAGGEGY